MYEYINLRLNILLTFRNNSNTFYSTLIKNKTLITKTKQKNTFVKLQLKTFSVSF